MSAFYNVDQPPFNMSSAARAIAAANNGLLFDPSDMSTMFQDAAGTVPVTAVEQPVGKILDKSGNGNHATQSITASRPVLSARYNLLTKTEDFSDAVWAKTNSVVTQNEQKSGRLFDKIVSSSVGGNVNYLCPTGVIANSTFAFSLDIYSEQEKQITIRIKGNGATTEAVNYTLNLMVGINSINISKSFTSSADGSNILLIIYTGLIDTNFGTIWVDAADLRRGTTSGPYQRVNTAMDYDTNPALFPKYLKFDGVDDYLNLQFMNLYGGGAASIIAARDAVSQATDTYIISERSTANANPKYIPSRQLASGGNMDTYISNDTAAVVLDTTGSAFSGASDKIIRSVVDTGNNIKLFKNSTLAANDNYTRSGTLTLNTTTIGASVSTTTSNYASVKLYGLIITKSALTATQRVRCERFLAQKAGVQL